MGLVSKFFDRKGPEITERIWSTTALKIDDLATQVADSHQRGVYPVTVVHFKATQNLVADPFEEREISFHLVSSSSQFPTSITEEIRRAARTLLLLSDAIPSFVQQARVPEPKDADLPPISVHLAEHYPMPDRDQHVFNLDKTWRMPTQFTCYTALDEPWLHRFGIERVRHLLSGLGMDEETCLSHPQLTRSIRAAQKKIGQQVRREEVCDSCEEWVRRNLPERL